MILSLEALADAYAFESSPRRADLGVLHVPFDELTGSNRTEARLDASVRRHEPIALIGASGCGKSSVIAHVLGPTAEGVRWLLELPAALVVAVHPRYFEITSPAELLGYLDTRIDIPSLESASAVDAILRRRIETIVGASDTSLTEVLASGASAAVLAVYRESGSLRRALQVCHTALHDALSDGAQVISARHVVAAASAG